MTPNTREGEMRGRGIARQYAWVGTGHQLNKVRGALPIAEGLRSEVVLS